MDAQSKKILGFALTIALFAQSVRADVLVVDVAGAGDHTTITAALAAAVGGDTLLVESGDYSAEGPLTITGQSLFVVADTGAVVVTGAWVVRDLSLGDLVLLGNLAVQAAFGQSGLEVLNCDGSVRIQDCTLETVYGSGMRIEDAQDFVVVHCAAKGSAGLPAHLEECGRSGLSVRNSKVSLHDSYFEGGAGLPGESGLFCTADGGRGGEGAFVDLSDSHLYAMGCTFAGGAGGPGTCGGADGPGGTGLRYSSATHPASMVEVIFEPGTSPAGMVAPPFFGDVEFLHPTRRELIAPTVVRENTVVTWTLLGRPGDRAWLPSSASGDWRFLPSARGVLALGPPITLGPLVGVLGSSTLTVQVPVGGLPPGVESQTGLHQLFAITGDDERILGGSIVQIVLDESL